MELLSVNCVTLLESVFYGPPHELQRQPELRCEEDVEIKSEERPAESCGNVDGPGVVHMDASQAPTAHLTPKNNTRR